MLPPITPQAIRDEFTEMVANDLLGPAGGPHEELDQRKDLATEGDQDGMLAPMSTPGKDGLPDTKQSKSKSLKSKASGNVSAQGELVVPPQPDLFESTCA